MPVLPFHFDRRGGVRRQIHSHSVTWTLDVWYFEASRASKFLRIIADWLEGHYLEGVLVT